MFISSISFSKLELNNIPTSNLFETINDVFKNNLGFKFSIKDFLLSVKEFFISNESILLLIRSWNQWNYHRLY